jgi:hypothetical protein
MNEIVFIVEDSPEGGCAARSAGESIFIEADTRDQLHAQVAALEIQHAVRDESWRLARLNHLVK